MLQLHHPGVIRLRILASKIENSFRAHHLKINFFGFWLEFWLYPYLLKVNNSLAWFLCKIFFLIFIIFEDPFFQNKVPTLPCLKNVWALFLKVILVAIIACKNIFPDTWSSHRDTSDVLVIILTVHYKSAW